MDEQEEFEFRARREREAAAIAKPKEASPLNPRPGQHYLGQEKFDSWDPAFGLEAPAKILSSAIAVPASGLAGLGRLATGQGLDAAANTVRNTGSALTYEPRSPEGRMTADILTAPQTLVGDIAHGAGGAITDVTGSPAAGTFTNMLLQAAAAGALGSKAGAGESIIGGLKRTPEAQRLMDQGIDLTPGQMNPTGTLSKIEQVSEHIPFVGEIVKDARRTPAQQFQRAIIEKGAAPGTKIANADANTMLSKAYESFGPLYDQAKGVPIDPAVRATLNTAFKSAASNRKVMAGTDERASVADWLDNEVSSLEGKNGAMLDSGQLIELRSHIREEIREKRMSDTSADRTKAKLLVPAEQSVTRELTKRLTPEAATALQTADSRYGLYKVLEDAVAKAKDKPSGFTAENLSQAIKESTPGPLYARGGGAFRQEAKDAKATFAGTEPRTGATLYSKTAAMLMSPLTAFTLGTKRGMNTASGRGFLTNAERKAAVTEALLAQQQQGQQ